MSQIKEEQGNRYGRLLVTDRTASKSNNGNVRWCCVCDCGNIITARGSSLRSGNTNSCGCLALELRTTHGLSYHPLFNTWKGIKRRCLNPESHNYMYYGGRGISICDRWLSFLNFITDVGPLPEGKQLDRINNDGNYEPENIRWVTPQKNSNNKRNNRTLEYRGRKKTISEWSVEMGIKYRTLIARVDSGWSVERYLTKSVPNKKHTKIYNINAQCKRDHPLSPTWYGMLRRCYSTNDSGYKNYGGRGITVCEGWQDFYKFVEDVSPKPEGHQLDRIDNNKGYSKENCRWATPKQNNSNRRNCKYFTHDGVTLTAPQWATRLGVKPATIISRLKAGWPLDRALSSKVRGK